ncbi:unnamed protein product [Somion occarium]|uniref:Transcription elongation factor Eaf N-terminal domain-containing protein n=1 Tax=Somion occarium TaxID=3059160 RepID=A0ABP1D5B5_9APHY
MSGRHTVSVGTSLSRALRARKGGASTKSSKLPEKDFFSFRYNFKPPSVDSTRPGVVEVQKGTDVTKVTVERASTHSSDGGHIFLGKEEPAKDVECILIWNEEDDTFTLEKLDSTVTLIYDRKTTHGRRLSPPGSSSRPSTTVSTPPYQTSASRPAKAPAPSDDLEAELNMLLEEDADGEPEDETTSFLVSSANAGTTKGKAPARNLNKPSTKASKPSRNTARNVSQMEQEEEDSEVDRPLAQSVSRRVPSTTKAAPTKPQPVKAPSPVKPPSRVISPPHPSLPPKPQVSPVVSKQTPAKINSTSVSSRKRDRPATQDDESMPKPSPPKRTKLPPPKSSTTKKPPPKEEEAFVLELPGTSSMPGLPPILSQPAVPVSEPPVEAQDDSEEEEWDDVIAPITNAGPSVPVVAPPPRNIQMEEIVPTASRTEDPYSQVVTLSEDEDVGMDDFEKSLHEELDNLDNIEEEDFLTAAMTASAPESQGGRPMSLNELAAAGAGGEADNIWGDDDDYSSSDDSDDD